MTNENRPKAAGLLILTGLFGLLVSVGAFAVAVALVFVTPGFVFDEIALGVLSVFGGLCSLAAAQQGNLLRAGIAHLDVPKADG